MIDLGEPWSVPESWAWTTTGAVAEIVGGGTPRSNDSENFDGGTIPWVTPADLSGYNSKYISCGARFLTERGLASCSARLLPEGSVLFSSRAPIGYVAIASNPLATNQGFKSVVPPPQIDPEYLYYYLQRAKNLVLALASGTTFPEVSGAQAAKLPLAIAPISEQRRIVAAIESFFTRLDDAQASLEQVQRNLKRFRTSVLKAAIEGRLVPTEAEVAHAEGRDYEPASALLARILVERRRRWDQLGRRGRYEEPEVPNTSNLPELPRGWCWVTWEQIGWSQNGRAFPSKEYSAQGIPLLRPGNLHESGRLKWTEKNTRHLPEQWAEEFPSYVIGGNELVMNLTAQSLLDEFLGRTCITAPTECCLLNQRIARLTPILVNRRFLLWLFKSPIFRRFVGSLNTGSLIQHMFTSQLAKFVLPLPPLAEQGRIAAAVDRVLSTSESTEHESQKKKDQIVCLRQSILNWAFEGKLIDQDPTDEAASILLERIRAARFAASASSKWRAQRTVR